MKSDTAIIADALDRLNTAEKALAESLDLQTAKSARLQELTVSGDLKSKAVITEIGELQIFANIFPTRIPALEEAIANVERDALRVVNGFISQHLGPRSRAVAEKIRGSVAAQLRPLLDPGQSLDLAVENSRPVQEAERCGVAIQSLPSGGVKAHANRVISAWEKLAELEGK